MIETEIENCIGDKFWPKDPKGIPPSETDWKQLEHHFGCTFSAEFHSLQNLMAKYSFRGGYLNIAPRPNDDDILTTCSVEIDMDRSWPVDLIPFYCVGNGDYVCLKASECPESAVYYIAHEDNSIEKVHDSLAAWIQDTEWFP